MSHLSNSNVPTKWTICANTVGGPHSDEQMPESFIKYMAEPGIGNMEVRIKSGHI